MIIKIEEKSGEINPNYKLCVCFSPLKDVHSSQNYITSPTYSQMKKVTKIIPLCYFEIMEHRLSATPILRHLIVSCHLSIL